VRDADERQAGERDDDADDRGRVLGEDDLHGRVAALTDVPRDGLVRVPGLPPHLAHGPPERDGLGDEGNREHDEAGTEVVLDVASAKDERPLDDREDRAPDEDHHRRHQRPEEALLAVAEGMRLVGTALAERERDEQKDLVQAVRGRVRGLGEQGARAREDAAGKFRHGDEEVRHKSEQDRLPVLRLHPSPLRLRSRANEDARIRVGRNREL
jgi:hypothetical protein